MKRLIALLLALGMVCTLYVPAFAGEDPVLYKANDKGPEVLAIKQRMQVLSYYDDDSKLSETFTKDMVTKVKAMQKQNGLEQTGTITQSLYDLMYSDKVINAFGYEWNSTNNYLTSKLYTYDAAEQFTVSTEGNVIVIILDYFASNYLSTILKKYPHAIDFLNDFTYYSNADSNYVGTYPSICHMLTGYDYNNEVGIGQWFHDAWTSETANFFFDKLHEYGYETHYYDNTTVNAGIKGEAVGKIDNLILESDYPQGFVKSKVYPNFYEELKRTGLSTTDRCKFFIFQHFSGMHTPFDTTKDGLASKKATSMADNGMGWFTIVNAYMEELKRVGAYDNSTIIITADHGDKKGNMQIIYYIKEAGVRRDKMATTNAPITHCEFQGTVLTNIGVPKEELITKSIYDFSENQKRERTMMLNVYRSSAGRISKYNGMGNGSHNTWAAYTYTGDGTDLAKRYKRGATEYIPMYQSFN